MTKKLLITGVGGFIGSHALAHFLVNTDWEIVGIDSWNHKGISERVADSVHYQLRKDRVKIYTHDLTAPISDILIDKMGKIDYIINFASDSHVDRSITQPVPFVQNNVNLILTMLEYAKKIKPEKFIQIGTDEVYGPTDGVTSHPEWDPIIPSNPYSASKAAQEAICISYWRTFGVPVILTNFMNQFGEMQDPEKLVPMTIKKVLTGEKIFIHSDSTLTKSGTRFWIHVRNSSDALLFMLNHVPVAQYPNHTRPERFNIAGEVQISNLDLVKMIAEIVGKQANYEMLDAHSSRPGHDLHYGLSSEKILRYGYKYPKNFKESLEKMVRWTIDNSRWLK
jgi:dTDP-glucose 4,6-dehydratase